jgi:MoaA/NifB/PqqE/SkfB family radical SAM enzyme
MKFLYLMNDLVVQEHVCNLRCSYCLNFENDLKGGAPWVPPERISLVPGYPGHERALATLDGCRVHGNAPILRLSGGEILSLPGGIDLIERVADDWERIQVLTNATLLRSDMLARLQDIQSINLCCSVDGHTPQLNRLRTTNPQVANRIIEGVLGAIRARIPVEVYMVLTRQNAHAVLDFARFLAALPRSADLRLFPFPVRGKVAEGLRPTADQLHALSDLLEAFDELSNVLPPRAYLERLREFYHTPKRSHRCRIPLVYLQTFDDGVVASCSNCWAISLGNMRDGDYPLRQIGRANIHKLFLRTPPRVDFCASCFTPFDVVNLYIDGDCSIEELASIDLFSSAGVRARLQELRTAYEVDRPAALWQLSEHH